MPEQRTELLGSGKRLSNGPPERLSDEALLELTAKWQDRLRLLHWDIGVGYLPSWEMGSDRQAECVYTRECRVAKIHLIDPATADPQDWPWDCVERTIVHELLHLVLAPIWHEEDPDKKRETESIIHTLSGALLECGKAETWAEQMVREDIYGVLKLKETVPNAD